MPRSRARRASALDLALSRPATSLLAAAAMAAGSAARVHGQQVADSAFAPPVVRPAYARGAGPVVAVDEAHHNFHTAAGRYLALAELLRRDGYVVRPSRSRFSRSSLRDVRILVIANALSERNRLRGDSTDWSLPTPTAFAPEEIAAVRNWIRNGGSLLLIADHMPFGGCAADLAAAFGVTFTNGFARDTAPGGRTLRPGADIFHRSDGTLTDHPITDGRTATERVDSVATFVGQAFDAPSGADPLLVFPAVAVSLEPDSAWKFTPETHRVPAGRKLQGAVMTFGEGRAAFFGEAAMFSAQLQGPMRAPFGMNARVAVQNTQFLLNVMHWLSGLLEQAAGRPGR